MSAGWFAGGDSVRGAAHYAEGLPNQDAIAFANAPVPVVAIADGHGSPQYVRSDVGAEIAVAVAVEILPEFVGAALDDEPLRTRVADRIVASWTERVLAHLAAHPFLKSERDVAFGDPLYAYGATLIAVAVDDGKLLGVQIGDGDLLVHDHATQRLFERDPRFVMNGTTSLCQPDAREELRATRRDAPPGTLVIAATDGYANSFVSDRDFVQIGDDYAAMIRQDGFAGVLGRLPEILAETTRDGSGDDITVGILYRDR